MSAIAKRLARSVSRASARASVSARATDSMMMMMTTEVTEGAVSSSTTRLARGDARLASAWTRARWYSSGKSYPSHQVIPFPSLSPTMTQGGIASWRKAEGDAVATGDILAEVQTDKAVMEMESMEDGYLAKILVPSGDADDIPVGKPVCVMCENEEDVGAFKDFVADAAEDASGATAEDAGGSRAVLERPDYRSIKEQGVPLRNSRASGRAEDVSATPAAVARALPADSPRMTVRRSWRRQSHAAWLLSACSPVQRKSQTALR